MKFIVISLLGPHPHGCRVIPENSIYLAIYYKAYGPATYIDCVDWIVQNCRPVQDWWSATEADAKARETHLNNRSLIGRANFIGSECRKSELGHIDGIPETKIEWEGGWIKYPVLYTRTSRLVAYVEICAPSDLMQQLWGDMVGCAAQAAGAGLLAGILASPAAALPAFKAAFVACISAKVGGRINEITVALSTTQEAGDWHRV